MKKLSNLIVLLAVCQFTNAQNMPQWVSTYGGIQYENYRINDIAVDPDGDSYVFGYDQINNPYSSKGVLIKYNTNGIQQWIRFINKLDAYGKIKLDKEGNIYIINRFDSIASYDYLTIKYNSNGVMKWKAIYNSPFNGTDQPGAIDIDDSLNVYITGGTSDNSFAFYDYTTVKYDSSGIQKWAVRYDGGTSYPMDFANAIAVDSLHNVYVTGRSYDSVNGCVATIKYNSSGNQQWVRRSFVDDYSGGEFIGISYDGYIFVGGRKSAPGYSDYFCIKYDTAGNKIWSSIFNAQDTMLANGWDAPIAMKLDKFGNVYMTGTQFQGTSFDDFATIKFNKNGVLQWVRVYGGGWGWDDPFSMALDNQGNVYVTGYTQSDSTYLQTVAVTIKYDSAGNTSWLAKFDTTQNTSCTAYAIGLDPIGNVYVSGIYGANNVSNFCTMKYGFSTGILEAQKPNQFNIYPNPSKDYFILEFEYDANTKYSFQISNMVGQSVLVNSDISSGRVIIDGSKLTTGIYIYQVMVNNVKIATGKLIKM